MTRDLVGAGSSRLIARETGRLDESSDRQEAGVRGLSNVSIARRRQVDSRVSTLELFFDLVLALALTQCTAFLANEPTFTGTGRDRDQVRQRAR